jgi:acyl-coenzyme A thioesterase PaaI-like protein
MGVEFKVNPLHPTRGESLVAHAEVIKAARTLSVVRADVFAIDAKSGRELVATCKVR